MNVIVTCDFQESENCRRTYIMSKRSEIKNRKRNNGKIICLYCSRKIKTSGRNNGNCKYKTLSDCFFENIDTHNKAYILGFIAGDGHISKNNTISIFIHLKDKFLLERIRHEICPDIPITQNQNGLVGINICSSQICQDVRNHLMVTPGKKSHQIKFPNILDKFKWDFLRGLFDADGSINRLGHKKGHPVCAITSNSSKMLDVIESISNSKCYRSKTQIQWVKNHALDFLGKLYWNCDMKLIRIYNLFGY